MWQSQWISNIHRSGKRVQLGIASIALVAASLVGFSVFGTSPHHQAHHQAYYYDTPPPHSCYPPQCYVHYTTPTPTTVPSRSQTW